MKKWPPKQILKNSIISIYEKEEYGIITTISKEDKQKIKKSKELMEDIKKNPN